MAHNWTAGRPSIGSKRASWKGKQKRQNTSTAEGAEKEAEEKLLLGGGQGGGAVLASEALDPAGGVHQLHFAGEVGVAGGADFQPDGLAPDGRASLEGVPAGAGNRDLVVVGMDASLHGTSRASLGKIQS